MPDIFKTFIKHMDGVNKAAVADAAARAMAEHCDARIDEMRAAIRALLLREQEFAKLSGFSDCRCINLSRDGEREYETGKCPHQIARKLVDG